MSETIDTTAVPDSTTDVPTTPPPQASLNVSDIQMAVRCIDYAADQGAYKGWDAIQSALTVRNTLNAFVVAVTPAPEETPTTSDTPEVSPATA